MLARSEKYPFSMKRIRKCPLGLEVVVHDMLGMHLVGDV